jgi:hypothetical protein
VTVPSTNVRPIVILRAGSLEEIIPAGGRKRHAARPSLTLRFRL